MESHELQAMRDAIKSKNFDVARHHLNNLRNEPDPLNQVLNYGWEIDEAERTAKMGGMVQLFVGFAVAALGYLFFSIKSPTGWTMPVWFVVAVIAIPAASGFFASRSVFSSTGSPPLSKGLSRAFLVPFFCMAIYVLINMSTSRAKIASADRKADMEIFLLVIVVNALLAGFFGIVSGLVFNRPTRAA